MPRTKKEKLGNVSQIGKGRCFNFEKFFVIHVDNFFVEKVFGGIIFVRNG